MKLSVILIVVYLIPCSLQAIQDSAKAMRAPRPDALSYYGSAPEIASPFDTAELAQIQQCLCQIKNILSSSCGSTPINQTGDVIISQPGSYCLINDVSSVTITSSYVTLDMGGYVSENLIISPTSGNISHIIVQNGFIYNAPQIAGVSVMIDSASAVTLANIQIDSDVSAPAKNTGINIRNSDEITIQDVNINRGIFGIYVDFGANNVVIDRASIFNSEDTAITVTLTGVNETFVSINETIVDASVYGLTINGDECEAVVSNCRFLNCSAFGVGASSGSLILDNVVVDLSTSSFVFQNNTQAQLSNCTAINFDIDGFVNDGKIMQCYNCTANGLLAQSGFRLQGESILVACNSYNTGSGYFMDTSGLVASLYECNAFLNGFHGFQVLGSTNCSIYNCNAFSNGRHGFSLEGNSAVFIIENCSATANGESGFYKTGGRGVVQLCSAVGNTQYGFFDAQDKSNPVTYYGNQATANLVAGFNVGQGKWPFFYKLAKNTAISVFTNVLAEAIIAA